MGLGYAVGVVGFLILAHAAYSTIQYRSLLKITEEEFTGPPITVVVELIAGLFFCLWAALTVPGKFLSILPQSDENRVVALPSNLDFMIFNHRGKVFPMGIDMKQM
ncbi:membrane magnesium transporter [Salvia divinorum]|uniref:Membrane magnesium transporter n=1 Tax=Salvia divinorum TaxID=28513 RepID=A0ABD1IFD7_SALDI